MVISTWADLVAGLDSALAFAKALNLDTSSTRFSSYRERINALDQTRQVGGDAAAIDLCRDGSGDGGRVAAALDRTYTR